MTQQIQFDENGTRIINATELINNKNVELTIQKKATFPGCSLADDKDLMGATLQLKASDANVDWSNVTLNGVSVADLISPDDPTILTWTSTGKSMTFHQLRPGTYEVSEIAAPMGYIALNQKWNVTVSKRGDVSVEGQENAVITITNEARTIAINKEALDGGSISSRDVDFRLTALDEGGSFKEIPRAIWDDDGNITSFGWKNIDVDNIEIGGKTTIYALPDGTYQLEEIAAPNGFKTISTFVVVKDGVITTVDKTTNGEVENPKMGRP